MASAIRRATMPFPEQFRSTSFRLGTAYAVLFFVSVMVILGTTYLAATSELEGSVRLTVSEDITRFRHAFSQGGVERLTEEIAEATEGPVDDRFYLLADADGQVLGGNLPASLWHEGMTDRKFGGEVVRTAPALALAASQNIDGDVRLFATGATLGGYRVMSARNAHVLDETQEVILSALLWSCLLTTILALVGGFVVSIGPTRRVDEIAAAMRTVAVGRFDIRLPISGRRDELDRLSRDINGMLERIEVLMSSLKQVSTDIAHDLRTPLARLRQRLDGARDDAIRAGGDGASIEIAVSEVDSIIETFNALLRIAQIEAGARKEKFVRLDLSALLIQLHEAFEGVAEDAGHRLEIDAKADLAIDGDRDLLQQLFVNLIENAMTHAPVPALIRLSARRVGDTVVASVADDGPGVPEEERETIFRRLYRLDRSRTTPGNGLGLALVAAIAELHEAIVEAVDNRPGLLMNVVFAAPHPSSARPESAGARPGHWVRPGGYGTV